MRKLTFAGALAVAMTLAFAAQGAAPGAKLEDRYAQNGAVKIHYVVEGKGPLVVLVHGFPDYWATWKPLMATLSAAGYRTAALDNRGYNLSDKPRGEAAYAMPNLVGDVAAVIAAEGQKNTILIGHDWAQRSAGTSLSADRTLVNKLIIMAVPHPAGMARELATNRPSKPVPTTLATSRRKARKKRSPRKVLPDGSRTLPVRRLYRGVRQAWTRRDDELLPRQLPQGCG